MWQNLKHVKISDIYEPEPRFGKYKSSKLGDTLKAEVLGLRAIPFLYFTSSII